VEDVEARLGPGTWLVQVGKRRMRRLEVKR
jgi:hypothetical protein